MVKKVFYALIIIVLLFVGVHRFLSLQSKSIDGIASVFIYPFLVLQHTFVHPLQGWWQQKASYKELNSLLQSSLEQVENLQKQLIETKSILSYKDGTKELTDFAQRYKTDKGVLAQVLFKSFGDRMQTEVVEEKDTDRPLHFFLIDAGKNKGIVPNMIAVYKNCLIGRVTEVYPYYSKVTLITDKLCKVAAYCSKNGVQGIHEGVNNTLHTRLTFVNHLDTVEEGDMVISSGEGLIFPRGFGLGYIASCEPESFSHAITIKPLIDLSRISYCYILQKGAELTEESKVEDTSSTLPEPPTEIPLKS